MNMELSNFSSRLDKHLLENLLIEVETAVTNNDPEKERTVQEAFREIHSLKGTAAFTQIDSLTDLLHSLEDALGVISSNIHQIKRVKDPQVFDIFFSGLDVLEELVNKLLTSPSFDIKDSKAIFSSYKKIIAICKNLSKDPIRYFEISGLDEDLF